MWKKIRQGQWLITIVTISLMLMISIYVSYKVYEEQIFNDLESIAYTLSNTYDEEDIKKTQAVNDFRITLIQFDGQVIYDNFADQTMMTSHLDRPEFIQAMQQGIGKSIRRSETLVKNNVYVAIKASSYVIRVSKEAHSIWVMIERLLPIVVASIFGLLILIGIISRRVTKAIVDPINEIAINPSGLVNSVYPEIEPFINTIREQHESILEQSNMRSDFAANVSHELKTPLTAISGYAELIENGMCDEEHTKEFAKSIRSSSTRLLTMINDILTLSKLDNLEIASFEQFDLFDLLQEICKELQVVANSKDIQITLSGEGTVFCGNKDMLHEAFINLIDNAIKYNHIGGHVWVNLKQENGQIHVEVKDNGDGISKENEKHIFERFYRVDKARTRQNGGTGLGLAIVKHIVEAHKGEIKVDSMLGKGSTFTIIF